MITRLEVTNYRCFDKLDANMTDFKVLAGANGSGKTTLLDIPVLLGDLLKSRSIAAAFLERIGNHAPRAASLKELIHRNVGETFILAVEAKLPDTITETPSPKSSATARSNPSKQLTHIRYEIRFQVTDGRQLSVQNEYLFLFAPSEDYEEKRVRLQGESGAHRDWRFILRRQNRTEVELRSETPPKARPRTTEVDASLLALPRVQFEPDSAFPAARWMYQLLVDGAVFYSPDWESLRMASPPGLPGKVIPSAANLPWLAMELATSQPERFQSWVDHVREALPHVVNIAVRERDEDHHAYFVVSYTGGHTVTSSGLSDGTLRVLALTLLPYLASPPALLVTEEPENGIHPRAIEAVLQSLSSLYGSQVWISSHSPVVLAHVELGQMLCMRMESDGTVHVVPGPEHPRLKDWKGTIDLGSLFAAGVLG